MCGWWCCLCVSYEQMQGCAAVAERQRYLSSALAALEVPCQAVRELVAVIDSVVSDHQTTTFFKKPQGTDDRLQSDRDSLFHSLVRQVGREGSWVVLRHLATPSTEPLNDGDAAVAQYGSPTRGVDQGAGGWTVDLSHPPSPVSAAHARSKWCVARSVHLFSTCRPACCCCCCCCWLCVCV